MRLSPNPQPSSSTQDESRSQIVALLQIPAPLLVCPTNVDLRLAYAKYQGYLKANAKMYQMVANGSWTMKTLTGVELIEVFVSKSVWHSSYSKLFPKVKNFALLQKWLENAKDAPSSLDVFGAEKQTYTFKDLKDVLETLEAARAKKGKRKGSDSMPKGSPKRKEKKVTGKGKGRDV
jgi:hypothetical protein